MYVFGSYNSRIRDRYMSQYMKQLVTFGNVIYRGTQEPGMFECLTTNDISCLGVSERTFLFKTEKLPGLKEIPKAIKQMYVAEDISLGSRVLCATSNMMDEQGNSILCIPVQGINCVEQYRDCISLHDDNLTLWLNSYGAPTNYNPDVVILELFDKHTGFVFSTDVKRKRQILQDM